MTPLDLAAALVCLAAAFGVLNHFLLRLPSTIGLVAIALATSLALMGIDAVVPGFGIDDIVRRVSTTKSYVSFKNCHWRVPNAFRGERVAIRARGEDGHYGIFFGATHIADIDLTT